MLAYAIRRFGQSVFVLVLMSFLVFIGVYAIGDPIELLVNPQADEAERVRASVALGLDRPFLEQYWVFLSGAASGDLGRSFVYNEPALTLILDKLPATIELAFVAMVMAIGLGIPLGLVAGLKPDSESQYCLASSGQGWSYTGATHTFRTFPPRGAKT